MLEIHSCLSYEVGEVYDIYPIDITEVTERSNGGHFCYTVDENFVIKIKNNL